MKAADIKSFLADEEDLNRDDYLFLTYWFETSQEPQKAAAQLCSEMSTAQWQRPGVAEDFRPRFAAKLVYLQVQETSASPSFKSSFNQGERFYRVLVRIAYPHRNFGPRLPNLLTAICGEGAFFSHDIMAIKLLDIEFPQSYLSHFAGPRFGIEGIRAALNVYDRPLFFGVVKPNVGLAPEDFAELAYQSWLGGLDVAKDDEMLCDAEYSPFEKRCRIVGERCQEAEQKLGVPKIYLVNITDEVDRLIELHDKAVELGAKAVMINGMTTGLSAVRMLTKHASVPVVAHFDFIAPFTRLPFFGVSSTVITKLQRLAGFDCIIMPGFGGRMFTEEDEVLDNVDACMSDWGELKRALPAPGGSDWAGTLPLMYEKLRSHEFAMVPGRGVFGHPLGAQAGARSLQQAWDAMMSQTSLTAYAKDHLELKTALEHFGNGHVPDITKKN